jgi:hypothetical protein
MPRWPATKILDVFEFMKVNASQNGMLLMPDDVWASVAG